MPDLARRIQLALGDAYRIERDIPGGGMSRLFLATETALHRSVVVKVLPPELAAGVGTARFRREVEVTAKLQHPHILPVLTAGSSQDLAWYVMPFVAGESLRDRLRRERQLSIDEAIRIAVQVADALEHAHRHGVLHRDIKPA
ncbi:MAG: serine/threonine protein kinase, partial [Gemmatimonadetes bacterium]|nr:serine/threonine protein kinase [Gemmatimonadota bacterium]